MTTTSLGRSGIQVSALGLGAWSIGGPITRSGKPVSWGEVDDDESIRAIHRALELGVTFFDTADTYGAGHSERVLGRALSGQRDRVVIATKFGHLYNESQRTVAGTDTSPDYVRRACEASLRRLDTDYIDLYQLHCGTDSDAESLAVRDVLEELVEVGKIRAYGWSTDDVAQAELFSGGDHCTAIQHDLNLLQDSPDMIASCEKHGLASVNRGPLARGLLTGKFTADSRLPDDDLRSRNFDWMRHFVDGRPKPDSLAKLDAVREILRSDGRSLAQGALAWLWARSDCTVPIPGFKTVAQVEDNAGAMAYGPLRPDQMTEIKALLSPAS
ncbi:aldo/keto reductase [Kribbella sp. VKM Ac-2566]|uniref:aldo/keto reductase n=1 Tax=Kribbella sp. VKM Ac-2566 TaxID=2512218 RepID=UPI001063717F|nr:aldo/keto reductase [Kribbella sp. VKM Ac-2566]TDX08322.1 aryl-alcohol dehydrogenase-like predicted oxidoreductase [Kribbella sp. VKM Ac-2566]